MTYDPELIYDTISASKPKSNVKYVIVQQRFVIVK